MPHGINRTITGFGPGNLIEKWLNAYGEGDVNRLEELEQWRTGPYGWILHAPRSGPYLIHIKMLSSKWPHLQLLADFMDVGTTPVRWNPNVPGGYPVEQKQREAERAARMERTKVTVLDYPEDGTAPERTDLDTAVGLKEHIAHLSDRKNSSVKFRLFVVEDLSREVIETLGARYDVDPSFFREHLVDYIWYNIKDWWRDPPSLDVVSRGQNWFQMRFTRVRYFHDKDSYARADKQAQNFNVYRPLQSDFNNSRFWDTNRSRSGEPREPKVGSLRSRVTFWVQDLDRRASAAAGSSKGRDAGLNKSSSGDKDAASNQQQSSEAKEETSREPLVGILLLDPTIKEGNPLWRQYRNWNPVPSMHDTIPKDAGPPRGEESSLFNDFVYWASRPQAFDMCSSTSSSSQSPQAGRGGGVAEVKGHRDSGEAHSPSCPRPPMSPACIPTQALLHLVCAEWLTLVDYIKTRLNQVDWEIAFPGNFLAKDEQIEKALGKLHYWRRVVPVYRAMLAETFLRVFRETKHPDRMHPGALEHGSGSSSHSPGQYLDARRFSAMDDPGGEFGSNSSSGSSHHFHHHHHHFDGGSDGRTVLATSRDTMVSAPRSRGALEELLGRECVSAYRQDYTAVLNSLEEYQARIDRLTEVVTAVISIQDSRRGYKDNKNLQWLTWLATFFIPLSFVATMLSMTTGPLDQLHDAAVMWAEVSIPSGLLILSIVLLMSIARCRRALRRFFCEFPWIGGWRPFRSTRI